ncbi:MAG: hypothetical protein D3925_14590 [Candidatus Electrothrix sp. AR5]|nr:hypothetical protein [Candidatus Electrothrix sp. AR5]
MHICMLTYYYWPVPAGGAENQCRRLSAALISRGHTCTVLTSRHNTTGSSHEVEKSGVQIVRKLTMEAIIQKIRNSDGPQYLEGKTEKCLGNEKKLLYPPL